MLFMRAGRIERWNNDEIEVIVDHHDDIAGTRFNDVIADPEGRVFCGTMSSGEMPGKLYRLDRDRKLTQLVERVGCSNGLGFTCDCEQLYYTDSAAGQIYIFDYDIATGAVRNRRLFLDTRDQPGVPDGMTVDANGNIWSARWEGACVTCHTPGGRELEKLASGKPGDKCDLRR